MDIAAPGALHEPLTLVATCSVTFVAITHHYLAPFGGRRIFFLPLPFLPPLRPIRRMYSETDSGIRLVILALENWRVVLRPLER